MQISQKFNPCQINQPNTRNKNTNLSFKALMHPQCYNRNYSSFGYNGTENDKFIEKNVKEYFPDARSTQVLDIGAGDGRNSIPLSKAGYNLTAYEVSDNGCKLMNERKNNEFLDNLDIVKQDILKENPAKDLKSKNFFDFAFMAHVSQHFNENEMVCVAKNVYQQLKKNGIFLFDTLIVNNENKTPYKFSEFDEISGQYGFKESTILGVLKEAGFKLISSIDYTENGNSRPSYIDCSGWGGKTNSLDIPQKPVTLKWLVWKK